MECLSSFRELWAVDFEFTAPGGERSIPLCVVARELWTGRLSRVWLDATPPAEPPYGIGPNALFIAYYASAELGCHLALGWRIPARILDLFAEFRRLTAGLPVPCGNGLLGALAYFGLDALDAAEKESMRQLAMRGGPYTPAERLALLDYCQSDVDALARLLPAMLPKIVPPDLDGEAKRKALGQALLRGRYMAAVARMEGAGVPIEADALAVLRRHWDRIKARLVAAVDAEYGVFVPIGERTIDAETALGAAILREADEWGIDPRRLAEAVEMVWTEERESNAELHAARRAARKATGLTARRIQQWEESGRDFSLYPRLDEIARDLAGVYPILGMPNGLTAGDGPDDTDHAGLLWDMLRDRAETVRPRHHPEILRRAAELVSAVPGVGPAVFGPMKFSTERWAEYLTRKGIPWPRLESGALALDDATFRDMARAYPAEVGPIRELRHTLGQLRLNELAVGSDGRNRCLLSAFGAKTGRNTPSNSRFIFGPSTWLRGLIRPALGRAVAYVDWEQQEFGIAAALSGDAAMQAAYRSGDPYLAFAKQAGAVPADATKKTHGHSRDSFKACVLAVQYGMGEVSLAQRIGQCPARARELLALHRQTYPAYWRWSESAVNHAMLLGFLPTVFGWRVHVGPDANARSLANFPMQANGAEMLRLACCLATERGIRVCAPVHDALLVEGDAAGIEAVVGDTQAAMREASAIVLSGFELRTEVWIVRHPDRYMDERGKGMWETVWTIAADLESAEDEPSAGASLPLALALPPPPLILSSHSQ
jgi:hypothetical protein